MSIGTFLKSNLSALAICAATLASPSVAGSAQAAEGALVVARNMDINSLDPARAFCDTCQIYLSAVYETLLTLGDDNKTLVPKLATAWSANADQTEFTFDLSPNAVFADGSPVTSADVAWSLQRLKNIKGDPSFLMDSVASIDTPSAKKVVISTKEPNSEFLGILAASYAGILNKRLAEANGASAGEDAATVDTADNWFFANSAGSGPYTLSSYRADDELRFAANPNYWGTKPAMPEVIIKQTADAVAQAQMLESGAADVAMQIDPDTAASYSNAEIVISAVPSFNFLYLALSPAAKANTTPLTKPIRQAIAAAIDYSAMIDFTVGGKGKFQPAPIPNGFPGTMDLPEPKEDIAKAKALLAEAGVPDGFTIEAHYPAVNAYGVDISLMMQKVQQDLARIGVTLNLTPTTFAVWREEVSGDGIPLTAVYYAPDYFGSAQYVQYFAMIEGQPWGKRAGAGAVDGVANPKEAELLKEAMSSSGEKNEAAFRAIALEMIEDKVIIPLVSPDLVLAARKGVEGVRYSACCNLALDKLRRE